MKKIKGIIPPMVTPLLDQDKLDVQGIKKLVERMVNGGVNAIFLLGTSGEAQSLSYNTRYDFLGKTIQEINGRVPVLVCISDTSMGQSIAMAKTAASFGASGVVAAPPYYFTPSQGELIDYYRELADASPLPLFLYNMPSHVKVFIDASTVVALSEHPNIVGLKDSSANMTYFSTLRYLFRNKEDFALYVGPEELTGECVLIGADGGINGGANLAPELYVSMYKAASSGDVESVKRIQSKIMALSTSIYSIGNTGASFLQGLKCALQLVGVCSGYLSYPYRAFGSQEREKVRQALVNLGMTTIE